MSLQPWQQARLEVLTRARNVQHYLMDPKNRDLSVLKQLHTDVAAITALDYEQTAMLRVFTDLVYERLLPENLRQALGVTLVHGLVGMVQHAWLCVEGDISKVNAEPGRCIKLAATLPKSPVGVLYWRVMIDVCAPDIEPSILLIAPTSPLAPQYTEQERFTEPVDYSGALTKAQEGAADETQEGRILKALANKHV